VQHGLLRRDCCRRAEAGDALGQVLNLGQARVLVTISCFWGRSDTVRLVGAEKEMLGVMSLDAALDLADEQELDVIVISPDADPPVCRLVSYDKFKYEEEKAKKVQSKKQREGRCAAITVCVPMVTRPRLESPCFRCC